MASLQLPNELWLQIFSHLDYFALKKCQRVCKNFHLLVRNQQFDKVLFRVDLASMKDRVVSPKEQKLHPALRDLNNARRSGEQNIATHPQSHVLRTGIAAEFATYPPRSQVDGFLAMNQCLHLCESIAANGVRVGDILNSIDELRQSSHEQHDPYIWTFV